MNVAKQIACVSHVPPSSTATRRNTYCYMPARKGVETPWPSASSATGPREGSGRDGGEAGPRFFVAKYARRSRRLRRRAALVGASAPCASGLMVAALAGAGVLAAVQWAERMKSAGAAREALEGSPAGEHGTPKVPVLRRAPGDVHTPQGLDRDASCDWGSPVRPSEREGNKTVSPSRLPRPRQLFSDRDHKANEVH